MYFKLPSNLKSFLLVLQTPLEIIYTLLIIRTFGAETYGTFQKLVLPSTILIQFTSFGINPATLFLLKKSTEFNSVVVIKSAFLLQLPILLTLAIPPLFFPDYFYKLSGLPQQWHYLILITTALIALSILSKPFCCLLVALRKPLQSNIITQFVPAITKFISLCIAIFFFSGSEFFPADLYEKVSLLVFLLLSSKIISWILLAFQTYKLWPDFIAEARTSCSNNILKSTIRLLSLSIPSGISGNILKFAYSFLDVTCTTLLSSVQFASYSLVKSILSTITILERPVETSISSILSNSISSDFRSILNILSSVSFYLYSFASSLFLLFGYYLISLILPDLDIFNLYIATLCGLVYVFLFSQISYINASQSQNGKPFNKVYPRIVFLLSTAIISYPLIFNFGYSGAFLSMSISSIVAYFAAIVIDLRTIKSFVLPFKFLSILDVLKIWKNPFFVQSLLRH
jgi:O-antigen/teichoic acid export membrane protein